MGSGASSQKKTRRSKASPTFHGNINQPLFNGLLMRIVDDRNQKWAFFNASEDYEFHVYYLFGPSSNIQPLGKTTMEEDDDGLLCQVVVYPGETQLFISGVPNGYECKLEALPLSDEYFATHRDADEAAYSARLAAPKAYQF